MFSTYSTNYDSRRVISMIIKIIKISMVIIIVSKLIMIIMLIRPGADH